jgi:hypothetical protein
MENYVCSIKSKGCYGRFPLVLGLFALVLASHETIAQRYYQSQKKLFLGLEGGVGMRTFKLRSDIKEIDQLNVDEEGFNLGVLFGGNVIQSRARIGIYQSSETVYQKIDVFEVEGGLNFYPLQIKRNQKPNYFRPYLVASLGRDKLSFFGSYELPKPPQSQQEEPKTCPNHTGSTPPGDPSGDPDQIPSGQQGPLPDPDQPQPASSENKKLGQIASSRLNAGLGMMLHIPSRQRIFMNLFAETKYGLSLNQQPSGYGLARTEVSKSLIVNFGICLGLKN